jgi:shikimate kinase
LEPHNLQTQSQELPTQDLNSRKSDLLAAIGSRSIVLVGLMGAGKSSIGRRMADTLSLQFVDTDDAIEDAAGMTIAEIFKTYGEGHFRDGERKVIGRLLTQDRQIIATGGGAFMNEETRAVIAKSAVSIWLKADLKVLMRRVKRRVNRPLLQTENPEAVMQGLMDTRYPIYAKADITVETNESPHHLVLENTLAALAAYLCPNWRKPSLNT